MIGVEYWRQTSQLAALLLPEHTFDLTLRTLYQVFLPRPSVLPP